jgi:hypothetical protein
MTADNGVLVVKVSSHPAVDRARGSVTKYGKAFLPRRGRFRWVDLESVKGHEQRRRRPGPGHQPARHNRAGLSLAFPSTNVVPHWVFSAA